MSNESASALTRLKLRHDGVFKHVRMIDDGPWLQLEFWQARSKCKPPPASPHGRAGLSMSIPNKDELPNLPLEDAANTNSVRIISTFLLLIPWARVWMRRLRAVPDSTSLCYLAFVQNLGCAQLVEIGSKVK